MTLDTQFTRKIVSDENRGDEVTEVQNIIDAEGTSQSLQGLTFEIRKYFFSKIKSSLLNNAALCSQQCQNSISTKYVVSKAASIEFDLVEKSRTEFEYKYSASRKIAEFERHTAENKLCEELKKSENNIDSSLSISTHEIEVSTEDFNKAESNQLVTDINNDGVPNTENNHSLIADDLMQKQSTPKIISDVLLTSKFDVTKFQHSYLNAGEFEDLKKSNHPSESVQIYNCQDDESLSNMSYPDWNDNDLALSCTSCLELKVQAMDIYKNLGSNAYLHNHKESYEDSIEYTDKNEENSGTSHREGSCISLDENAAIPESAVESISHRFLDDDPSKTIKRTTMNILRPIVEAYYLTELIPNKMLAKHIFRQIHWDILLRHIHDEREIKRYAIDTIKSKKYLFDKIIKTKKWKVQS